MKELYFVIIVLVLLTSSFGGIVIENPVHEEIYAPSIKLSDKDFYIEPTRVVAADPFNACASLRNNVTGLIVMVETDGCNYVIMYKNVFEGGAKAVILSRTNSNAGAGAAAYNLRCIRGDDVQIHGVEFPAKSNLKKMVVDEKREDVVISIRPDPNKFEDMLDTGALVAVKVILQAFAIVTMVFAAYKLRAFVMFSGIALSPPQICLAIEIIGSIIRIVYMVDPFFVCDTYNLTASYFLSSLTFLSTSLTSLFLGLYWDRTLSSLSTESAFGRMKNGFIGGAVLMILASMVYVIGTLYVDDIFFYIIYQLFMIPSIMIFFVICGIRVIYVLRSNDKLKGSHKAALLRITMYIIASCFTFMIMVIGFILFISPASNGAWSGYIIWWVIGIGTYGTSFLHVLAFQSPDLGASRSKESPGKVTEEEKPKNATEMKDSSSHESQVRISVE